MIKIFKLFILVWLAFGTHFNPAFANTELSKGTKTLLETAYGQGDIEFFQKTLTLLMKTQPDNQKALQDFANILQGIKIESAPTPEVTAIPLGKTPSDKNLFNLKAWGASAEFGFAASSGDNSVQSLSLGLNLSRVFSKKWDHALDIDIDFAKAKGLTSKERYFADYQLFYRAWNKAYTFGFMQAEHDKFSGFDYQLAESIGIGYTVLDSDKHKWSFEGGPGVRHNKLDGNGVDNEFMGFFNNKYRFIFSGSLSVGNETKIFIGTTRFSADNTFDLIAKFNAKLSAHFSFQYKYDSNVPFGRKNADTLTKATLVYDF